jgi:hypothetical protein
VRVVEFGSRLQAADPAFALDPADLHLPFLRFLAILCG